MRPTAPRPCPSASARERSGRRPETPVPHRAELPSLQNGSGRSGLLRAVERVQDLNRLGPQRPVNRLEVGVGQLAGAVIQLGVADLAVLGLTRGLELGDLGAGRTRRA